MNDQSKIKQVLIKESSSLEYAESIINTVHEPLIVLNQDLRVVTASRSFYEFFKVNPEETVGQLIYDLGNKQWDIPKLRELLENILPQKTTFDNYEVEQDFAAIGRRVMLLNARQIERASGKKRIILLAIEDITERKRLENILTDSEELYKGVFKTASDGIVLLEKSEGKITHTNPAAEKMLGYSTKDSIGNKLSDIGIMINMDDFQVIMQNLNKNGIINYTDVSIKTKSGQYIDTDLYLVDKTKLVQCNIRDISKRKEIESQKKAALESLRESEERYKALFDRSLDFVYSIDFEGCFIDANAAALNRFGYTSEEIHSLNFTSLLSEDQLPLAVKVIREIRETGIQMNLLEFRLRCKGGTHIYVETHGSAVMSNGIPVAIQAIARDITERKLAEAKLQQTLYSLKNAVGATIQVMVSAVEMKDPYTAGHQLRTADLACAIATEMGLAQEKIDGIHMAASIHDIGKLSIPAEILSKPTKLTNIEFSLIKEHVRSGYEMLKDVQSPWLLAQIVYQHHERMDGSGYPRNLKGDEIIMEARIMAVADVVEAMASHRPYRPALGIDATLEEIEKNRGILYDASVADACLRLFREKGYNLIA
ncbi:MAG: PAS domain S-box protein [Smithella sp.]|jgi:PAS domain S-box-containing protein